VNVPHILMTNGDILFTLPEGPHYVTPMSFNYRHIKSLLPITLEDLTPLLVQPPTPDGVYYVHASDRLYALHVMPAGQMFYLMFVSQIEIMSSTTIPNKECHGVYVCIEDILTDYPEYFL